MHQGNIFVDNRGNIIPVDFGGTGRLDKSNRKFLAQILYGFIQRDYVKVAEVHFQAGLVPQNASKEEFAQALRSVGEPIFGQSIKDISGGNLLSQLFEITEKFNMPINRLCYYFKNYGRRRGCKKTISRQIFGKYLNRF